MHYLNQQQPTIRQAALSPGGIGCENGTLLGLETYCALNL
jgi:hypothetical protein